MPASDVYALAVTLYVLLAGPHVKLLENAQLPPLRTVNPAVRVEVEQLLQRALAPAPEDRPTAQAFLAELETLLAEPWAPLPPAPRQPPEARTFVGREHELVALTQQLQTDHYVVLAGPPGIGKTALASTLARHITTSDRVFWHSFHAAEGADVLNQELAAFLAHHGQERLWRLLAATTREKSQLPTPEVLFGYVLDQVRNQGYLLCLDDLQYGIDDPLLGQFLKHLLVEVQAGAVQLVVTTREIPSLPRIRINELAGLSRAATKHLLDTQGTFVGAPARIGWRFSHK